MTAVTRWEPTGIRDVDRAVATWRPASMVPAQFKDAQGNVKLDDLALAAHWLYALDVPPVPNVPMLYVIKGRVGVMAELQRALLARAGYDLEVEGDEKSATARIKPPGQGWKPPVTVTMVDAERAGWTKRSSSGQPSNYELIPDRMLAARACTRAISLYAAGVLHGIAAPAANIAALDSGEADEGDEPPGPAPEGPGSEPARKACGFSGPGGTADQPTMPEFMRTPIDDDTRARLVAQLEELPAEVLEGIETECRNLGVPNVRGYWFFRPHARLLELLMENHRLPMEKHRSEQTDEATPAGVHDDSPEAYQPDEQPF